MRKPMVTRSITSTKVVVLCLNTTTCEAFNEVLELPRTFKDEAKLMKLVSAKIDNDEQKAVKIVSKEIVSDLRAMTEEDFLAHSFKLDAKTRKAIEEGTDVAEEAVEE